MGWKRIVGKLLVVGAGTGALVLVIFVLLPWLTAPQEPVQPMAPEEIVEEVLGEQMETAALPEALPAEDMAEDAEQGSVMPVPSPLLAVRDDGEALPVLFPRQEEPGMTEDPVDGLPPVLSLEEVVAAMSTAAVETERLEPAAPAQTMKDSTATLEPSVEDVVPESVRVAEVSRPAPAQAMQGHPEAAVAHVGLTLPPASATRDVQALLQALGYAPGPLDGIWGVRTEEAWHAFADDAAGLEARVELAQARQIETAVHSVSGSPLPSLGTVEAEGRGAEQAGATRPQAGLPSEPVVVPGTLRGVMGYRLPLVSRQEVPDQVVAGVLIPAHTTFVILKPGYWELTGLSPDDVALLRDAAAQAQADALATAPEPEPVRRGWNPLRLFRKRGSSKAHE